MAKKAEFSIETVKKYIFWVMVPLGLLFTVIVTVIAVGNIGRAFENRKNALNSQKSAVEKIRMDKEHPNENTIQEIDNRTKELRGRVVSAWTTLEKDQRERNTWPVQALGPAFIDEVSRLKTFDEISIDARELYLNFIEKYLPELEVYVDRRRTQIKEKGEWKEIDPTKEGATDPFANVGGMEGMSRPSGGGPSMGGGGTPDSFLPKTNEAGEEIERQVGTVDWAAPETRIVTSHWGRLPKSNEVWFAQEELWVYHALLTVVKNSNTGATGPHNAAVKRIESLLIGQLASQELSAQLSLRIGAGGMGGGMMGDSGMMGGPGMMGGSPDMMGSGMGGEGMGGAMVARTEEDVITIKKNYRYVDDNGVPLASTDTPPFAQFNRMPIVLRLVVDQRRIPEILVNCANSAMPIDVLRVRINPDGAKPFELSAYDAAAAAGGEGGMGGMGGGPGGDVGYGGGGRGAAMSGAPGGDDVQVTIDGVGGIYGSNAVPIEIYGCISIFNPVEHDASLQTTTPSPESPAPTM